MIAYIRMNLKRVAAIVCGPALLVVWLAAAAGIGTPEPAPAPVRPVATSGIAPLLSDIVGQSERLRKRLEEAPVPQSAGRNPFQFAPVAQPAPARVPSGPLAADGAPVLMVPPAPPLSLVGVAENQTPEGLVRTALISGSGQFFMVKVDEPVTSRFRVTAIGADAVELLDLTDNSTLRLALK